MNPNEIIEKGKKYLDPIMTEKGLVFQGGATGSGSGGQFAEAKYVGIGRELKFSFRYSLGCVEYHVGSVTMGHKEYLRGVDAEGRYPGFSKDKLSGFVDLASDIEKFGDRFFNSTEDEFQLIKERSERRTKVGLSAI